MRWSRVSLISFNVVRQQRERLEIIQWDCGTPTISSPLSPLLSSPLSPLSYLNVDGGGLSRGLETDRPAPP